MTRTPRPAEAAALEDDQVRCDLARVLFALFRRWGVPDQEALLLLGLHAEGAPFVGELERGEQPLPKSVEVLERAGLLLNMHRNLRLLFPENEHLRYGWVRLENREFMGKSPLQVMNDDGYSGIRRVAARLQADAHM